MNIKPTVLQGDSIRLEPLSQDHIAGLCDAGLYDEIWLWTTSKVSTCDDMRTYVDEALEDQARGMALPFATIEAISDKVIGCTRFGNIDTVNKKVEIGWTWLTPGFQRTSANTQAKLLMLTHAFDEWKCVRVELKTDALNQKSRNAILRIGATEEGTLRQHMVSQGGRLRDTVYFSIIDKEWPETKARLRNMLDSFKL